MIDEEAAHLFLALSNPDRLRIIRALVVAGPEGLNAGDIAKQVGASASRASFHLASLSDAGIIHRQRQSRSLRYRVDFARLGALVTYLMRDCCNDSRDLKSCCP
ncbi:MAG: metalloregulator ArsR/SmtB family transcription factor [Pseudomonadota bacterium]